MAFGKKAAKAAPVDGIGQFNNSAYTSDYNVHLVEEAFKAEGTDLSDQASVQRFGERASAAFAKTQPAPKVGQPNPVWTMAAAERDKLIQAVAHAEIPDNEAYGELRDTFEKFGPSALHPEEKACVEMGFEMVGNVKRYMDAAGDTTPWLNLDDSVVRDTGRYVKLKGGMDEDGKKLRDSQFLMEIAPEGDVHRFVDLECPAGQGQIIHLMHGTYEVAGEYEKNDRIQAGIDAASASLKAGTMSAHVGPGIDSTHRFDYSLQSDAAKAEAKAERDAVADRHADEALHAYDAMPSSGRGAVAETQPAGTGGTSAFDALMREKDRVDSREAGPQAGSDGHGIV